MKQDPDKWQHKNGNACTSPLQNVNLICAMSCDLPGVKKFT